MRKIKLTLERKVELVCCIGGFTIGSLGCHLVKQGDWILLTYLITLTLIIWILGVLCLNVADKDNRKNGDYKIN